MRLVRASKGLAGGLTLTQRVGVLSLVPMVVLGFALTSVIERQVEAHSLSSASQSARLIANIGIQPRLTAREIEDGLTPREVEQLDEQLRARSTTENLARIKIWNSARTIVYSDDHNLIGHTFHGVGDVTEALEGHPSSAAVITPKRDSETDSEVGLGELLEVYVPLRFTTSGPPVGVFEVYLSYGPIAAAITHDKRVIALVVAVGLALLWLILFRIVAQASRRLRRQSLENDRLARYDPLTGLPNRTLFRERVNAALRRPEHKGRLAVLLIDLDGFTEINSTLGNATGDKVLCAAARRLQSELGEHTLIARIGGDEYAILCPHAEGVSGALRTAARLQASMDSPIVIDGIALNIDASLGLAVADDEDDPLERLLQHADAALARARSQRSRVEVYSASQDNFDPARLVLLGQVHLALERDEFELHYQPKIDLRSKRACGVEALLRWRHPEHGLLMPLSFVPLVEQTALVDAVTERVLELALRQMVRWREQGLEIDMSVNLSARNLLDLGLPDRIQALLRAHWIEPERLTVEVTESATMAAPERAAEVLAALRERRIKVSIDDFGTGNASIAYLTQLPASEIKIDKAFITNLCEDARAEAIAGSTVDLARHLGLHVVAEGIETAAVLERLVELGCDTGQGYLISRPLSGEDLTDWLTSSGGMTLAPAGSHEAAQMSAMPSSTS